MNTYEAINKEKNIKVTINKDENVGYYLIVYPVNSSQSVADYLYDTLEDAFSEVYNKYGIGKNNWEKKNI